MPDPTYGTPDDVERSVKALFPAGFSAASVPTDTDVEAELANYQAQVRQILKRKLPELPPADSDAGKIAVKAVVAGTVAWALGVALAGRPDGMELVRRWEKQHEEMLRSLREMPDELRDPAQQQARLRFDDTQRESRYSDAQLSGAEPIW